MFGITATVIIFLFSNKFTSGEFRFANSYGSNMVLQRAPLSAFLWGFGEEGQVVRISVNNIWTYHETVVDRDSEGNAIWRITLPPIEKIDNPYRIIAASTWKGEKVEAVLDNILFGDVWLCSGQSNMGFTVGMSSTSEEELVAADERPDIRIFTLDQHFSTSPLLDVEAKNIRQNWTVASRESIGGPDWKYFSAVCWMYGRRLYDDYRVPIGLIATYWGGTCVEAWSSPDVLSKCGLNMNNKHQKSNVRRNLQRVEFGESVDDVNYQSSDSFETDQNSYSVLWNAMINPLTSTTIKGVVWYQGEQNNWVNPDLYACTFPEMINDWRRKWYQKTVGSTEKIFPFGFVQLAALGPNDTSSVFPKLRYQQTANYGYVPNPKQQNVFMAVAMDLPDDNSPYGAIHPRDKSTVAYRLSLGASAMVYGEKNITFKGPIMSKCGHVTEETKKLIRVDFDGLKEEGLLLKSRAGFEVRLENGGKWVESGIYKITNDSLGVLISIPENQNVTMVRYAWSNRPCDYSRCAIYSLDYGLPSPPGICFLP